MVSLNSLSHEVDLHSLNLNVQLLLTPNLKILSGPYHPLKLQRVNIQKQLPGGVYKIGVPKNFTKFTGKHLCWGRFLIKL